MPRVKILGTLYSYSVLYNGFYPTSKGYKPHFPFKLCLHNEIPVGKGHPDLLCAQRNGSLVARVCSISRGEAHRLVVAPAASFPHPVLRRGEPACASTRSDDARRHVIRCRKMIRVFTHATLWQDLGTTQIKSPNKTKHHACVINI